MNGDYRLISGLLDAGQWSRAEQLIRSARKQESNNVWLITSLALCLMNTGRVEGAAGLSREALTIDTDWHFAHFLLGKALPGTRAQDVRQYRKLLNTGRQHLIEAIRLDPAQVQYHAALAENRMLSHEEKHAAAAARAGLEIDPEDIPCRQVLARALIALGQRREADRLLLATLAHDPDDAATHAHRGWGMLANGRHQEARIHFEESLRLYPHSDWARVGLQEALKRKFWPYRWLARILVWLARRDTTNSRHFGLIAAGYIAGALFIVGFLVLAAAVSSEKLTFNDVGLFFLVAAIIMLPISVLIGMMPTLARWIQDFAGSILLLNQSGRKTLPDRQRMRLLILPTLVGWIGLLVAVFAFLPESTWGLLLLTVPIPIAVLGRAGPWRHRLRSGYWIGLILSSGLIMTGTLIFRIFGPGLYALLVPAGLAVLIWPTLSLKRAVDEPV